MNINNIEKNIEKFWFTDGGHLSQEQKLFYIQLFTKLQPKTCLEIGFAGGRHTATMLCSCSPKKVISVDIDLNYHNGKKSIEKIKNSYNNIEFIEANSNTLLTSNFFLSNFPDGLDYVLVDGGHSYAEALQDMENCYPYLNKGGIMIVDDFESGPPIGCPIPSVDRAVKYFASKNSGLVYETIKLIDGKGMALFHK